MDAVTYLAGLLHYYIKVRSLKTEDRSLILPTSVFGLPTCFTGEYTTILGLRKYNSVP